MADGRWWADLTFGDSHAMWAQHYSGMFSQIDLRDATKPLDAIPRVSATWGASGALAFVADKTIQWEAPYDDTYERGHRSYYSGLLNPAFTQGTRETPCSRRTGIET